MRILQKLSAVAAILAALILTIPVQAQGVGDLQADRILGRITTPGPVQQLTAAQVVGFIDDTLFSGVNTWTAIQTFSKAGNAALFVNTTDVGFSEVVSFQGDRATPADLDTAWMSLKLSDDGGTQAEFARITWQAEDVNVGTNLDGGFFISLQKAGVLTTYLVYSNTLGIYPFTTDGISIGWSARQFSDLFLAEGGVINWDAGDVTATQTGNSLAIAGGLLAVPSTALTIATGAVTATQSYHVIDTQSAAASDDLDTISGGVNGAILYVRAANDARTVVVKDATGNIQGPGDCTLDNTQDIAHLMFDSTLSAWLVVACANNGA